MPRVSRVVTERNRAAIERESARLFREQGLRGVSVAELMAAAGLTHGGFYGHFESKDALATVACTKAFDEAVERWQARISATTDPESALTALVDGYLSSRNRRVNPSNVPIWRACGGSSVFWSAFNPPMIQRGTAAPRSPSYPPWWVPWCSPGPPRDTRSPTRSWLQRARIYWAV